MVRPSAHRSRSRDSYGDGMIPDCDRFIKGRRAPKTIDQQSRGPDPSYPVPRRVVLREGRKLLTTAYSSTTVPSLLTVRLIAVSNPSWARSTTNSSPVRNSDDSVKYILSSLGTTLVI